MSRKFASQRPPEKQRKFTNATLENVLQIIQSTIADRELAWMFGNCFLNTPDTTVFFEQDSEGRPDTYVITGDIEAMWLRDSTAQVWPYLNLAAEDEKLRLMLAGVIHRQARSLLLDPYANAFYKNNILGRHQTDHTEMRAGVHERKWELDSPAAFFRLSSGYWRSTSDLGPFDRDWQEAVKCVLTLLHVEQDSFPASPYRFQRSSPEGSSLANKGMGDPCRPCGLIRSGFRPSDDLCKLPYLIPSNAMIAVALEEMMVLLTALNLPDLAADAGKLSATIRSALEVNGLANHPIHGEIWAYEVDGYGGKYLMDDANVPSLLSLPYIGFCSRNDPRYLRTRTFCLSRDNPYFRQGGGFEGVGSPHTRNGTVWPLSIIIRAITSEDEQEIVDCLTALKKSHADTGFIHESFDLKNPGNFSRSWFAWANTLFGELIVSLYKTRRHLLQTSLS